MKKNWLVLLIGMFIVSFMLMVTSAKTDSQTTDEAIHLVSGYTYLTQRDFRLDSEHPPFLKELAALPLIFQKVKLKIDERWQKAGGFYYDSWQEARLIGENFFYGSGNDPEKLLFWGRLPFIFLTLILGYFSYFWAKKLYGQKAGVFAGFLTLFFPNFLAHGRLINTDLGVALFIYLTVFSWGNFLKRPRLIYIVLTGLTLGLTLASKFTGLIIIPILLVIMLVKVIFYKEKEKYFKKYFLGIAGILVISFLVIWATYGFTMATPGPFPTNLSSFVLWNDFQLSPTLISFLDKIRFLFSPAEFYKGIFMVFRHAAIGHSAYLLGQSSTGGWWYYFPVAIFYKTPIPVFFFLAMAIFFWGKLRVKEPFEEILLIIPPAFFLFISLFSKADLGIRHILPIFPFIFVFASKSINLINLQKAKFASIVFVMLIGWYFFSAISSFPNFLSYFNEFVNGPKGGYRILADSNLDWGQDIYRLKKYLEENRINRPYLFYPWNGEDALRYYQIDFQPLAPFQSDIRGQVIISDTYLQTEGFLWLKKYPFYQITPGLFLFEL